jgi:hypothetical protein
MNRICSMLLVFTAFALVLGCNRTRTAAKTESDPKHDHDSWWCEQHGIPEHLCSQCLPEAKVKSMFKDQGDWCELHDRAKSQCFICDASKYKTFEDMYTARYGKAPKRPPEEEFKK